MSISWVFLGACLARAWLTGLGLGARTRARGYVLGVLLGWAGWSLWVLSSHSGWLSRGARHLLGWAGWAGWAGLGRWFFWLARGYVMCQCAGRLSRGACQVNDQAHFQITFGLSGQSGHVKNFFRFFWK